MLLESDDSDSDPDDTCIDTPPQATYPMIDIGMNDSQATASPRSAKTPRTSEEPNETTFFSDDIARILLNLAQDDFEGRVIKMVQMIDLEAGGVSFVLECKITNAFKLLSCVNTQFAELSTEHLLELKPVIFERARGLLSGYPASIRWVS